MNWDREYNCICYNNHSSMAYELESCRGFIQMAVEVVGKAKRLTINTNIYAHCAGCGSDSDEEPDQSKDIIKIRPSGSNKYIQLNDIMSIFAYAEKQFKNVYEGRSYCLEGIQKYNDQAYSYEICWGS